MAEYSKVIQLQACLITEVKRNEFTGVSKARGREFSPFAQMAPHVGQEIPWPRQGVLLQCTCTGDERTPLPLSVGTTTGSGAGNP